MPNIFLQLSIIVSASFSCPNAIDKVIDNSSDFIYSFLFNLYSEIPSRNIIHLIRLYFYLVVKI